MTAATASVIKPEHDASRKHFIFSQEHLDLPPRAKRTFKVKAKVKPVNYDLKVVNTARVTGGDVAPADDKDKVGVKGEPPIGPEPCPGRAATLRC